VLQSLKIKKKVVKYYPDSKKDKTLWKKEVPKLRHPSWLGLDYRKRKDHPMYREKIIEALNKQKHKEKEDTRKKKFLYGNLMSYFLEQEDVVKAGMPSCTALSETYFDNIEGLMKDLIRKGHTKEKLIAFFNPLYPQDYVNMELFEDRESVAIQQTEETNKKKEDESPRMSFDVAEDEAAARGDFDEELHHPAFYGYSVGK
jgi:hypothetical protein